MREPSGKIRLANSDELQWKCAMCRRRDRRYPILHGLADAIVGQDHFKHGEINSFLGFDVFSDHASLSRDLTGQAATLIPCPIIRCTSSGTATES